MSPFGIVKAKVVDAPADVLDVEAEAEADVPAAPVVVSPTRIIGVTPSVPS